MQAFIASNNCSLLVINLYKKSMPYLSKVLIGVTNNGNVRNSLFFIITLPI